MSAPAWVRGYVAWMLVLAALSFAVPSGHLVFWVALGLSGVIGMVVGILRNRPRHRGPWFLLAGAAACLAVGDTIAEITAKARHENYLVPSLADVFYLLMYVFVAAGFAGLYRLGVVRRSANGVLDALTVTTGVALLSWVFLIGPYVVNPDLTLLEKVIAIAYPLGDILGLGVGASLLVSTRATTSLRLLAAGGIGMLGSDIAYGIVQLKGTWREGTAADAGWVLFYLCWALAALHPSMRELTEPKAIEQPVERPALLVLLALASLIAPTTLAIEVITDNVRDGLAIAVLSAMLSLLVLARLARAARIERRSAQRERALRRAGAQLLSATDVDQVSAVVNDAVGRLALGESWRLALDLATQAAGAEAVSGPRVVGDDGATGPEPGPSPSMIYATTLPPEIRERLDGFEVVLRCELPAERGSVGALYIAAEESVLATMQEAAQVLAGQAGQTLQRIALGTEVARRNSEAYFRTLVLNTTDVILILDVADRIRFASPSAGALFEASDVIGAALPHLVEAASYADVRLRLDRVRAGQPDARGPEWHVHRPGKGEALVEATCRDLRGEPTVAGLVITLRDVTESRQMQDELYRRATYDGLTGLPNREVLLGTVQAATNMARADGNRAGVIVAGLDEFKFVNTTMGHRAGDDVLALVGRRLSEALTNHASVTPADGSRWAVARLGGDEFAAALSGVADQADIDNVVAAIRNCLTEPFTVEHGTVTVRTSLGVAVTAGDTDARELLRQADLALSVAKDAGKGRVVHYEESLHALVADRLRLRNDLERAVSEGSFLLEYQPIVALPWPSDSRSTAGFEALVRWHHPERGRMSPAEFIPLAEESGLIIPLGNWVLHHAICAAAAWLADDQGHAPYVSVNVSARQLRLPDFAGRVRDELTQSGLPPQRLTLEITESLLAGGGGVAKELARLRADGVRIAIDDFGTGFSALSYLRQLPVDVLKLDKSFVDSVVTSTEQYAVMATVTQLARMLRLDVVAEGIETDEELEVLATMGCGFGQGFLIARPMSEQDAVRWLQGRSAAKVGSGDGR